VLITRDGKEVATLHPQKRVYRVQKSPMTESGIEVDWNRDLFVAMGEDLGAGAWSVRVQYKPMVRFIWLGALVMALGGLISISDRRYRTRRATADDKIGTRGAAAARSSCSWRSARSFSSACSATRPTCPHR
jgi:cytochrome c-type biogenesis protein CcmF